MERKLTPDLKAWKTRANRKPLMLRGARQVGKTWLMKELGRQEYRDLVYINFESNALMRNLFETDFDVHRIIKGIETDSGKKIVAEEVLLIFDEIQACPAAITSLKYFYENAPQHPIVCAGSLLGVALHHHTSFPVGKIEFLDVYPLTFTEFLNAVGKKELVDLLNDKDWPMINAFSLRFTELLRQYYFTGGMPEVVNAFRINEDYEEARRLQKQILEAYELDFSKHAPINEVPRIRMIWNGAPAQLSRENKKFVYGHVRQGARAKDYEMAISWLRDCGLIHTVNRVSKPSFPLNTYADIDAFKLFIVDVGLLGAMTDLDKKTLLEGNRIFQEFKGALTEQYVLQQLMSDEDYRIFYWSAENARAEVDFLVQKAGKIYALEIKAEENLQAKSLKIFADKFSVDNIFRASMSNYRKESWMTNIPLYAISALT